MADLHDLSTVYPLSSTVDHFGLSITPRKLNDCLIVDGALFIYRCTIPFKNKAENQKCPALFVGFTHETVGTRCASNEE